MSEQPKRLITDGKGRVVETHLTDDEARKILDGVKFSRWADSTKEKYDRAIQNKWKPFDYILYWLHAIALEQLAKQQEKPLASFPNVIQFFTPALSRLKRPGLTFRNDGGVVQIKKWSRDDSSVFWVSNGATKSSGENVLYGRLEPNGDFFPHKDLPVPVHVLALLDELGSDPVSFIMRYGVRTGNCCFCDLHLEDPHSLRLGYGPVCAGHYGLPHGRKGVEKLDSQIRCEERRKRIEEKLKEMGVEMADE